MYPVAQVSQSVHNDQLRNTQVYNAMQQAIARLAVQRECHVRRTQFKRLVRFAEVVGRHELCP